MDAQAQEEVDRVLGDRENLTVTDFKELRYCMRCVNESMRLYPHPPVLLRRANVPDTLPGRSSRIFNTLTLVRTLRALQPILRPPVESPCSLILSKCCFSEVDSVYWR